MEKTITIDGKQVRLKSTAATVKRYKAQFRRDLFADMLKLGVIAPSNPQAGATIDLANADLSKVDFEVVYASSLVICKKQQIQKLLILLHG